ncbi:SdiA-regulated domain-containing protein [uncultured Pontibacter sp.]|uniref:SdiA-regulated domain-containing protein n=1 Tax=uncultured Pontibacter sp. TaxID=453356 RepID=UPI0026163EB6|nr:SdiA-regulated domain-containing protein [uncultured Pontibacter sp.]
MISKRYILACILSSLTLFSACDNIWLKRDVPDAVKVGFIETYPNIKQVDWDKENGLYEAEFKISGRERVALFQEDGKLVSYTEEIDEEFLPGSIHAYLQQYYQNYKVEEVHRIQASDQTTFKVELEQGSKEKILQFTESGELLRESSEAPQKEQVKQNASLIPLSKNNTVLMDKLGTPDNSWELPAVLREVSGIALLPNGTMACIQDEEGKIFIFDLAEKKTTRAVPFAGPGDYEAISVADGDAYVLRSDGTIFEVSDFEYEKPTVKSYKISLPATINMEGMAYDAQHNRLLLAPKGYDPRIKGHKAIYIFSLETKRLEGDPLIKIPLSQVAASSKKRRSDYDVLQPSSLEINPSNQALYLLDAVNQRIYMLEQDGKLSKSLTLDKKILRQAEGLTFDEDGAMYIASEGSKKGKGVILKYTNGLQ